MNVAFPKFGQVITSHAELKQVLAQAEQDNPQRLDTIRTGCHYDGGSWGPEKVARALGHTVNIEA